jgi:DNA-binding NtrC family response regulator
VLSNKILIIDDSVEMRNLLERVLARNYQPTSASSGLEAIELARGESFGITFLASRVLRKEGYLLLNSLKALNPHTHIVVVADSPGDPFLYQLKDHDIYTSISKPFTIKEILDLVKVLSEAQ